MILSEEIRRLRTVANMTVREASAAAHLALTAWSDFETGRRNPSDEARERISLALGMPADHLAAAEYVCGRCRQALPCACPPEPVIHCRRFEG